MRTPAPPQTQTPPPDDANEARLLDLAVRGDAAALEELLVANCGRLLEHIQRKIPSSLNARVDPEDILQQTYLEAIRAIDRFEARGPGALMGWLRTIAGNKLIDASRKKAPIAHAAPPNATDSSISDQIEKNIQDSGPGAGTKVMREELKGAFHVALANLPAKHREIVQMRYIEDRSLEEVAQLLGVTVGAARGLCHRARQALRDEIGRLSRYI